VEQEEKDFERFLSKQQAKAAPRAGDELLLHSYLERETTDEKERFLRDFVLNNGWLNKGSGAAPGPRDYKIEIDKTDVTKPTAAGGRDGSGSGDGEDGGGEAGDAGSDFDDQVDEFEHRYNFRFEEPGGAQVVSHARTVDGSMRRPDERRKAVREARRRRKQHEKLVKTEEIKMLKNVKKSEIAARLLALQEAAGDGADFAGFDLDADFDPDDFGKQMEARFGDEYYAHGDEGMEGLRDDDLVVASEKRLAPKVGDAGEGGGEAEASMREDVERLMDEYYSLDYEDIIGGTPVRFKYKKVDKETFHMDAEEILAADDRELNHAVSLKYLAPYRTRRSIPKRAWKQNSRGHGGGGRSGGGERDAREGVHARRKRAAGQSAAGEGGDPSGDGDAREKGRSQKERGKKRPPFVDDDDDAGAGGSEARKLAKKQRKEAAPSERGPVEIEAGVDVDARVDGREKRRKRSKGEKKKLRQERSDKAAADMPASRLAAYVL
jgi:protein KRI1